MQADQEGGLVPAATPALAFLRDQVRANLDSSEYHRFALAVVELLTPPQRRSVIKALLEQPGTDRP